MALATAAAITGGSALAAYFNAKYHIGKELGLLMHLKRAQRNYNQAVKENRVSLWYLFEAAALKHPNTTCLWSREGTYTWTETRTLAIQYANWFISQGLQPNQLVAFYLTNQSELIIAWLGLWCMGCAPAFINFNLEGAALDHCLQVSQASLLLVDQDGACQARISRSRETIETKLAMKIHTLDSALKASIISLPSDAPSHDYRASVAGTSPICLFYTSGTTGLPKASAFTAARLRLAGIDLGPLFNARAGPNGDCWYICMPMYHATGAVGGMGCLLQGLTLAIGKRFSVSNFWKDVHDSQATFFVYVGETARYLLNAPLDPWERRHKIRCVFGNGLSPDVWEKFRDRFGIQEVAEFFNSTEGMFVLQNWDRGGWYGACVGHHGLIMRTLLHNMYVPVHIDYETGDIWRHPTSGFARRMKYEEGGEIIVKIPEKEAFQGYWNMKEATEKKFVRDVFKKGDIYYRTGDALRRLPDGRWYFMDRLGDTFRWKSENVSTAEVAQVLGQFPGVVEANVYGVLVPNHEGRAGCAALLIEKEKRGSFDYDALLRFSKARLPRYAVPVFLRVVETSSHIHNLKQNKVLLRREGVDPGLRGVEVEGGREDMVLWSAGRGRGRRGNEEEKGDNDVYVEFTDEAWKRLQRGEARL